MEDAVFTVNMGDDVHLKFSGCTLVEAFHSPEHNSHIPLPFTADSYEDIDGATIEINTEREPASEHATSDREFMDVYVGDEKVQTLEVIDTPNGEYYDLPENYAGDDEDEFDEEDEDFDEEE